MKITDKEFIWKDGTIYKSGEAFYVVCGGELFSQADFRKPDRIANSFTTMFLAGLEFELWVDWSKIEKDTKVKVSKDGETWFRRHFDCFDNGKVFVYFGGRTSFTSPKHGLCSESWKVTRLAE